MPGPVTGVRSFPQFATTQSERLRIDLIAMLRGCGMSHLRSVHARYCASEPCSRFQPLRYGRRSGAAKPDLRALAKANCDCHRVLFQALILILRFSTFM